ARGAPGGEVAPVGAVGAPRVGRLGLRGVVPRPLRHVGQRHRRRGGRSVDRGGGGRGGGRAGRGLGSASHRPPQRPESVWVPIRPPYRKLGTAGGGGRGGAARASTRRRR